MANLPKEPWKAECPKYAQIVYPNCQIGAQPRLTTAESLKLIEHVKRFVSHQLH